METRFSYHFEPNKGWMNDPNGLVWYRGYYHAFFQHNPYAPKWDTMHWGHAISKDLLHWEEKEIALFPDKDYENEGGCFSGSAIEKDGRLYLFYTSVSKELGQTQSVAYSDDGFTFTKYEGNPVIDHFPADGSKDFRDPKVLAYGDHYIMVLGSCKDGHGRVLMYESFDLLHWEYAGILYESDSYTEPIECPDFFPLDGKYVLMFSKMSHPLFSTQFVTGTFDGRKFTPESLSNPEMGPQFYAPQTFLGHDNRRIMIGWFYDWKFKPLEGITFAGALTLPRELSLKNGKVICTPISEAKELALMSEEHVTVDNNRIMIADSISSPIEYNGPIESVEIYKDKKAIEVFINNGECNISAWLYQ